MKIKRIVNPFALASPRLGGRGWGETSLEIVGQKQIRLRQIINTSSRTDADKSQARRLKNCPKEGEGKGRAMLPEILEQIRWGRGEGVARVRMVC